MQSERVQAVYKVVRQPGGHPDLYRLPATVRSAAAAGTLRDPVTQTGENRLGFSGQVWRRGSYRLALVGDWGRTPDLCLESMGESLHRDAAQLGPFLDTSDCVWRDTRAECQSFYAPTKQGTRWFAVGALEGQGWLFKSSSK